MPGRRLGDLVHLAFNWFKRFVYRVFKIFCQVQIHALAKRSQFVVDFLNCLLHVPGVQLKHAKQFAIVSHIFLHIL